MRTGNKDERTFDDKMAYLRQENERLKAEIEQLKHKRKRQIEADPEQTTLSVGQLPSTGIVDLHTIADTNIVYPRDLDALISMLENKSPGHSYNLLFRQLTVDAARAAAKRFEKESLYDFVDMVIFSDLGAEAILAVLETIDEKNANEGNFWLTRLTPKASAIAAKGLKDIGLNTHIDNMTPESVRAFIENFEGDFIILEQGLSLAAANSAATSIALNKNISGVYIDSMEPSVANHMLKIFGKSSSSCLTRIDIIGDKFETNSAREAAIALKKLPNIENMSFHAPTEIKRAFFSTYIGCAPGKISDSELSGHFTVSNTVQSPRVFAPPKEKKSVEYCDFQADLQKTNP